MYNVQVFTCNVESVGHHIIHVISLDNVFVYIFRLKKIISSRKEGGMKDILSSDLTTIMRVIV